MKKKKVRALSLCVFYNNGSILVRQGYDKTRDKAFFRPLGGKIKFGEHSCRAMEREIREELGIEVQDPRFLGVLESFFSFNGKKGHEILMIYDGRLANPELYAKESLDPREPDEKRAAVWKPLADFRRGAEILYPDGLLELLAKTETAEIRGSA